jgi:magnesium chelatase subunit I
VYKRQARKYGQGIPLTFDDKVHLVELPLNSSLDDVVGGLDERALVHERLRLKKGILAQADLNILFVDEVNLLKDDIVDAILDGAAQGSYTVRRGPHTATYRSRFSLIGSMNPEEGWLRPQIMDRFGLRVILRGLTDPQERQDVSPRVHLNKTNPRQHITRVASETEQVSSEIKAARALLPSVKLSDEISQAGIELIHAMEIPSIRSEITLFESARAYTAMDGRQVTSMEDLRSVAPMALRLRRSSFIDQFMEKQGQEEAELKRRIHSLA